MLANVQIGSGDPFRLKRRIQRPLIHRVAASDIDDDAFPRQFADQLRIEEVIGSGRRGKREDEPVRVAENCLSV